MSMGKMYVEAFTAPFAPFVSMYSMLQALVNSY